VGFRTPIPKYNVRWFYFFPVVGEQSRQFLMSNFKHHDDTLMRDMNDTVYARGQYDN
jgi:hypothetical protein